MNKFILHILILFVFNSCGIKKSMEHKPDLSGFAEIDTTRIKHSDSLYSLGNNQLYRNDLGVWEMYLEGNALERGIAHGNLGRELIHHQENAFMSKLEEMVPSEDYRGFLKTFVSWFNRKLYLHVSEEYKQEIYGVSRYGLDKYDDFAPAYIRMLYFHGAHDIGHALQDLMLVGCTSFAAWDDKTSDGELLIGRNFDFYAGDDFGEQKIAAFVNPEKGHRFMMYTWGGMIGALSGMNMQGITVTINAGKSRMPLVAKTPISLLAREILQYAGSIEEAIAIAKKREVFVSESIMVGSGDEKRTVLIEVSPRNFGVYEVENRDQLVCSNHFQSEAYSSDRNNKLTREESHTQYRYDRMQQLIDHEDKLNPLKAVEILRDRQGVDEQSIGMGNEKAINQLLAHHGIVFKPSERKVWVSSNPYQMGEFIHYDLNQVFADYDEGIKSSSVSTKELNIPASSFLQTQEYQDYEAFRVLESKVKRALNSDKPLNEDSARQLVKLNPDFWEAWYLAGKIYYENKDYKDALIHFKQARKREITTIPDLKELEKMIRKSTRKI
ncbi:acyl-CoA:6-aminopenicillanic acid acyl transferase [Gramella sp. Hel_I_59]|uniref:C45 family autoproteolytic acyltransferase/hydolase n=1 Tax=Gramella sp. Hel_I_59 TaxID=1249978 RepID=UPI001150A572|nr:C45 family autoproteolytic acyltransferase/hydolase [Gramella sp. Hel_I_59]TQI70746.1 acyl-CoA:6-aminopenicillanic acid acyl transferase [Gramella sp. Hel_I_59]